MGKVLMHDSDIKPIPEKYAMVRNVLDQGYIQLYDWMGSCSRVLTSARESFNVKQDEQHDLTNEDKSLLGYLVRHNHGTPLESVTVTFFVRAPIYVNRQWFRHRMASYNELSARYKPMLDICQHTEPNQWRKQSTNNKQGSSSEIVADWPQGYLASAVNDTPGDYLSRREAWFLEIAREIYEERLLFGVAKEQARKDMPLSNYSDFYVTMNMRSIFNFLELRMDSHAQQEIREYANAMYSLLSHEFPHIIEAFDKYIRFAATFSQEELSLLRIVIQAVPNICDLFADNDISSRLTKREIAEFFDKLQLTQST